MTSLYFDIAVFLGGWAVAQLLFNGFEAHVPWAKRLTKLVVMAIIFFSIRALWGRPFFYGALGVMAVGMAILHGYWFHYRHGIHWRTAEPRHKYLQLIGEDSEPFQSP